LVDEDVGGQVGAGGDCGAGRPDIVRDGVVGDGAGGAVADLNAVLRGAGGGAYAGNSVGINDDGSANFIGGDAIFLKIVNGTGLDGYRRTLAAATLADATLDQNAGAALTAV
jgi:hypothetical protein